MTRCFDATILEALFPFFVGLGAIIATGAPDGLAAVRYKWSPSRSRVRTEHSAAAWF